MRKIWAVVIKEMRQVGRDPLSLTMLLGIPAGMLLLYGFALNFDVKHAALALQDRDKSAASRELVSSFVNSTYFDLVAYAPEGADLERLTELRAARAVLVIPESYGTTLASGGRAQVQFLVDGTDALTATTLLGYASAVLARVNADLLVEVLGPARGGATGVGYDPRVWYNPELESTQFLVPGLIGFILMLTAVISTALSVVREKERGTMEQLRVTALRPGQLIVGKTIPYLVISLAATVIILAAARVLFSVEVKGPYLALFFATLLYLFGALGFGLLVSSFSRSQAMAFQVGLITSMLPSIFLSGFIFEIKSMPPVLQWLTYAVPARYYLIVLRGVILKGAGLAPYADQMVFLFLYALIVVAIAWMRLVRTEG